MTWRTSRLAKTVYASSVSLSGSRRQKQRYRSQLLLEPLEGRCVPTTITPTIFADGGLGSGSLRDAVLQFNADTGTGDDIVQLLAGTYALTIQNVGGRHETAGLTGDLNLTQTSHRWIIQGAGSATIIDASQLQDRVFDLVTAGTQVVFRDLVLQGGLAQDDGSDGALAGTTDALGGGILNNGGDVTLDNVVVQNNVARGGDVATLTVPGHNASGGGLYSADGALTLAGTTLANNQASGGRGGDHNGNDYAGNGGSASAGGLYATGGSLDISDSMVASNRATGGRGGDGSGSSFRENGGRGGAASGGGLYVNGSALTIATSTIATNQGTGGAGGLGGYDGRGLGGGLYNGGRLTVNNCTLSGNSITGIDYDFAIDPFGGGVYNAGTLTVSNSTFFANSGGHGGAIYNFMGTLAVSNSTLFGNSATGRFFGFGGGIYNYEGGVTVSNSTLSENVAFPYDGGGIANYGTLTVSNSTLSGNSGDLGGGIANGGTLTVSNSTLSGNSAEVGGGIANSGTVTVSNSTLSGNSARLNGGGIYNDRTLTVSNSTLSGNTARAGYGCGCGGGGIYTYGPNPVTLTNVTLTANRAINGGGLYVYRVLTAAPVLHNTLIAGNFGGPSGTLRDDVYGRLDPVGDYNLIGDGTDMTGLQNGVNGNQVGNSDVPIDPLLGPLQDNGGPTHTHALLPGSPAIDAGNNAYATDWDQRGPGYPRIVNRIIDIGAFEYQGGGSPGRSLPLHANLVDLNVAALLSVGISRGWASVPGLSLVNAQPRGTSADPQIAFADRLFASFNQGDAGFIVPRIKRVGPIARDAQEQIAMLEIIPPEPVSFETPFQGPLPRETLGTLYVAPSLRSRSG